MIFSGVTLASFLVTLSLTSACDSKKKSTPESQEPVRQGPQVTSTGQRYYDGKTGISGDGATSVFISGRADDQVLKAYSFSISTPTSPATRITSTDIGSELFVAIAPDAPTWAMLVAEEDQIRKLYIQQIASPATLKEVSEGLTPSGSVIGSPVFSPGTEPMLAFMTAHTAEQKSETRLSVAQIDASGTLKSSVAISNLEQGEINPQLQRVGSQYYLLTQLRSRADGSVTFLTRSFSTLAEAGAASPTRITPKAQTSLSNDWVAGPSDFWVIKKVIPLGSQSVSPAGNKTTETLAYRQDSLGSIPFTGDTITDVTTPQFQIQGASPTNDGKLLLVTGNEYFSCSDFEGFASSMIVRKANGQLVRLVPRVQDGAWDLTTDPCDKGKGELDYRVLSAILARSPSADRYHIVYVSWLQNDFEVRQISFTLGDEDTLPRDVAVANVSANPAP